MRTIVLLIVSFAFFTPASAFSPPKDSTKTKKQYPDTITANTFQEPAPGIFLFQEMMPVDTTIRSFSISKPNPKQLPFFTSLGNIGLPGINLTQLPINALLGYSNMFRSNQTGYCPDDVLFFNTRQAFSEIFYMNGSKKENLFHITHTQNINQRWNAALNFRVLNSEGFLTEQISNHRNFVFSSNYSSKNNRLKGLYSFIYNKINNNENGGLDPLESLNDKDITDARFFDVNLSGASSSLISRFANISHIYALSPLADSSAIPALSIGHKLKYSDLSWTYLDDDRSESFYPVALNEPEFPDTIFRRAIDNHLFLAWNKKTTDSSFFNFTIGGSYFVEFINNAGFDTVNTSIRPKVSFQLLKKTTWELFGNAHYAISGYDAGDYSAVASLTRKEIAGQWNIGSDLQMHNITPDRFLQSYRSTFETWENPLLQTQLISGSIFVKNSHISLRTSYASAENFVFLGFQRQPLQFPFSVGVLQCAGSGDYRLGKWHFFGTLVYQASTRESMVKIPELLASQRTEFRTRHKKNVLEMTIGYEILWFSQYSPQAYNPLTGSFYLQDEIQVGNYPFIDLFLTAKIKRVRVLVKMEHLNKGITGTNYLLFPGYPAPGRAFKVGISWIMLN